MHDRVLRMAQVIQTEATTTARGDFLMTHAPIEKIYLNKTDTISEEVLFQNYLLKNPEKHKLIMVQGGNGTGKSHLIRWLKEKYQDAVDPEKEASTLKINLKGLFVLILN